MDDRRGSITVGALMGTGAATLSVALFGLAGLGPELRAADRLQPTTPIVSEDLSETLQQERRSPKWDGHSALPGPAPSPSPLPTPQPQKEL